MNRPVQSSLGTATEAVVFAAARVGSETLKYVANINTYDLAYTDFYRENLQRQLQRQTLSSPQP